jgi:AraC-like DNA-binding protein
MQSGFVANGIGVPSKLTLSNDDDCALPNRPATDDPRGGAMNDLVPIPLTLFERLARAGLDVDAILRRANLPRSRFNVARPEGTTAEFFALWRAVEESNSDPSFGLRLGAEAFTDTENVVVLVALHSDTLGEGLQKLARYKRVVCPEKVSIDVKRGEAQLRFEWLLAKDDPPMLLTDITFAGVVHLAQCGTAKPVKPLRLEFARRPPNEAILRRHFGCELCFEAPYDLMVFDEAILALPMVNRNAQLLGVLVPGLELALPKNDPARTLADDVRETLTGTIYGDRPAVSKVARSLGMSVRTLQRRLGELGTTYQDVLDNVRHRSARRLLASTNLGMGEVAFLLGFEEVNSFMRAFHVWEGTTPARWRARGDTRREVRRRDHSLQTGRLRARSIAR